MPNDEMTENHFSVTQTKSLKGILAVVIVFHHLSSYLGDSSSSLLLFKDVGFLAVGGFFFISGYGLCHGVINKPNYMKGFLLKRFLPVFFTYTLIDLSYWACKLSINMLDFNYMIKTFFALNDNLWFASVILWLYVVFYACFKLFKGKKGIIAMTVCVAIYVLTLFILFRYSSVEINFGFWWYNSIPCFTAGMWYCYFKNQINRIFRTGFWIYALLFPAISVVTFLISIHEPADHSRIYVLISQIISALAFSLSLVIWSYKIKLGGKILSVLGDLSFELYLFHAIFIWFFRSGLTLFGKNLYIASNDGFLTAVLVATFVSSYVLYKIKTLVFRKVIAKKS